MTQGLELERAEAAAIRAADGMIDTGRAISDHGQDPRDFARLLASVMVESDHHGLEEIPIEQALRAGVAAERLWREGLGLDLLLDMALAVSAAVSEALPRERVNRLGRALVLVLTRCYLDAEVAEHQGRQHELRALITISRAVNRTLDPVEVAEAGLTGTLSAMGLDAGGIWVAHGGVESLELAHTVGVTEQVRERIRKIDLMSRETVAIAIRSGLPAQFDVSHADPQLGPYRSALIVPLRGAHDPVGLLAVGSRRRRVFDQSEVAFAAAVADHLAAALDHAFEHRREAHTDYLTGLANRSEFDTSVRRELAGARRHRRPLSLMLMDLDELKKINDNLGHHAGDEAIRVVAAVIRGAVRTSDICARLGGDEFGVAMPDAGLGQAAEVEARIQQALRQRNQGDPGRIELSFGLAEWQPAQDYSELFEVADRNLYRDKRRRLARRKAAAGRLAVSKGSSDPTSSPATRSG